MPAAGQVRHPAPKPQTAQRIRRALATRTGYTAAVTAGGLVLAWWASTGPWSVLPVTVLAAVLAGSMWVAGWTARGL